MKATICGNEPEGKKNYAPWGVARIFDLEPVILCMRRGFKGVFVGCMDFIEGHRVVESRWESSGRHDDHREPNGLY